MKIYAITISGKLIPIEIEPTNTIKDLKNKIHEKENMSPERQKLIFSAQVLDDDKALKDYAIKDGTKIALHFNRFDSEVIIFLPNAEEITVEVDPTNTIRTIKEKLFDKKGFPIDQQRLYYHFHQLKDDNTLSDYSFRNSSKLFLILASHEGTIIFVNSSPYLINMSDTVESLKNQVYKRTLIPIEDQILLYNFQNLENSQKLQDISITKNSIITLITEPKTVILTVILPTEENLELEVSLFETIDDIKANINDIKPYPVEQQHLIFNGKEMLNGSTINDYSITKSGQTVDLIVMPNECIIVYVETNSVKMAFPFKKKDKIYDIKAAILEKTEIPIDLQILTFDGQIVENEKIIEDFNCENEFRIFLSLVKIDKMTVAVKPFIGKPLLVDVQQNDTILNIKEKINELKGFEVDKQKLYFNGRILENEFRIQDYLIQNNSTLILDFIRSSSSEIMVNFPDGEKIKFNVDRKDRIDQVKEKIKQLKGFPIENQKLFLNFTELENSNRLQNYSIITGGRVNLVLDSKGTFIIFIKIADDIFSPLAVKPTDLIDDVKSQISKREEISLNDQKLIFDRKEIENGQTLQEVGVTQDKNIINLELRV